MGILGGKKPKYGEGEEISANTCPHCRKRRIKRSGLGTCGNSRCLAAENRRAINDDDDHYGDRRKTAKNERIWIKGQVGREYRVVSDKTVRGKPCYVLKDTKTGDKITVPIENTEMR